MNRRLALLQAALSLISLAAVAWWVSHQEAPEIPSGATAILDMLAAGAIYSLATAARSERWHRILRRSQVPARRADSYGLTPVGYMGNNVLPARAGEMLRVVLMAPRTRTKKRDLLGTVVAERLLDALALALIFVALAYGLVSRADVPGEQRVLFVGAGLAAAGAVGLVVLYAIRHGSLGQRLVRLVRSLSGASRDLLSRHGLGLLLLSFAIWTLEAAVYLAVGRAVDLDMGLIDALYVVAITNLFAMVPAAPGYVGTFDAAVLFGIKAIGAASSAAISYLLLLRFVLFVPITVVGLVLLVARYGGWSRVRSARLEASSAA